MDVQQHVVFAEKPAQNVANQIFVICRHRPFPQVAIQVAIACAIPTSLDNSSQKQLDKLNDAKPNDFASEYDPMQVSAHEDAVSLFERYSKSGDNAKLKDWASKTLPALQHHLQMAEQMNSNRSK